MRFPRNPRALGLAWLTAAASLLPGAPAAGQPVEPVPELDLARYAGLWYEIARYPQFFQRNCAGEVTARYTLREDGRVDVHNRCRRADGREIDAKGVARRSDPEGPASRLEVRFAPGWLSALPFVWADYWVIDLDPQYRWAVVGSPSRKYLWILSRTPRLDEATYERILRRIRAQGYDTDRLMATRQEPREEHRQEPGGGRASDP
jgi:apolipoprotein D and lipocalin family protein